MLYLTHMELKQKLELRKLLAPELRQSLQILALPIVDLGYLVDQEMLDNPVLEEVTREESLEKMAEEQPEVLTEAIEDARLNEVISSAADDEKKDYAQSLATKKVSLQDFLLKQLGMFTETDEDLAIGTEIIGNLDENGYLRIPLEDISQVSGFPLARVEKILGLVQQFEPAGVAARSIPECLLIQLKLTNELTPALETIICNHLEDIASKNYSKISKALKETPERLQPLLEQIIRLNPKPGRNFTVDEAVQIVPDIIIEETDEGSLKININHENIPRLIISKTYRRMLKQKDLDAQTREFLTEKLRRAQELMRAIVKRSSTLRRVIEVIAAIQEQAIRQDMSQLKPLTFREVADKIQMHESTVCRVVMNKYCQTPCGVFSLKDFFPSKLNHATDANGDAVSSEFIKGFIKEYIDNENKKSPLSDEDIVKALKQNNNLEVARRTVAKYREELKILASPYRRQR